MEAFRTKTTNFHPPYAVGCAQRGPDRQLVTDGREKNPASGETGVDGPSSDGEENSLSMERVLDGQQRGTTNNMHVRRPERNSKRSSSPRKSQRRTTLGCAEKSSKPSMLRKDSNPKKGGSKKPERVNTLSKPNGNDSDDNDDDNDVSFQQKEQVDASDTRVQDDVHELPSDWKEPDDIALRNERAAKVAAQKEAAKEKAKKAKKAAKLAERLAKEAGPQFGLNARNPRTNTFKGGNKGHKGYNPRGDTSKMAVHLRQEYVHGKYA